MHTVRPECWLLWGECLTVSVEAERLGQQAQLGDRVGLDEEVRLGEQVGRDYGASGRM